MMPISGVNIGAGQPMTGIGKVPGVPKVEKTEEKNQGRPLKPVMDEYIPEEPQEPSGRYWLGKDEDGQPKIYFDDPERAAELSRQSEHVSDAKKTDSPGAEESEKDTGAKGPEKKEGKEEVCKGNTDKVDREIEALKKKREELEQRLNTETDETRIKDLERQLAQVERELKQKDNDMYRKQHSTFTRLS